MSSYRILCYIFFVAIYSCDNSKKSEYSIQKSDTTKTIKVSIEELITNTPKYYEQYVETEGFFYSDFESFDLIRDRKRATSLNGFHLDFRYNLFNEGYKVDSKFFDQIELKKVRIKGLLDTSYEHHGSIDSIYYIKRL